MFLGNEIEKTINLSPEELISKKETEIKRLEKLRANTKNNLDKEKEERINPKKPEKTDKNFLKWVDETEDELAGYTVTIIRLEQEVEEIKEKNKEKSHQIAA
ncbi:MAG: hypothetical protein WDK96_01220 [Candidatus Paceibacterota bacterium]|jgi:hypothetical protein